MIEPRRRSWAAALTAGETGPPPRSRESPTPLNAATGDEPLRFERLEIRPAERLLRVDGSPVELGARAFDLLLALAQRRDRIVSRNELLDLVWPGVVVEEHNITAQISTLRKLIGPDAIATIPGRGYRFTAAATETGGATATASGAPAAADAVTVPPPQRLTPLFGRADELAELSALIGRERLVTIVGAGGIGKTLLARHVMAGAQAGHAHGACWIELAGVSDGAQLPLRIADALNVRVGGADPLAGLCAAVAPLSMVVALDNAEHLVTDVARVVDALLDAAPAVRVRSPARRRCASRPSGSTASARCLCRRGRCRRRWRRPSARWRCSSTARAAPMRVSCWPTPTRRRRSSCAGNSTACRWRSNWPPRARRCSACGSCSIRCSTGCNC
jgi:DNA-binding winged helix-turn-helix (wHTH) protein